MFYFRNNIFNDAYRGRRAQIEAHQKHLAQQRSATATWLSLLVLSKLPIFAVGAAIFIISMIPMRFLMFGYFIIPIMAAFGGGERRQQQHL